MLKAVSLWETYRKTTEHHLPYEITPATQYRWTCPTLTAAK